VVESWVVGFLGCWVVVGGLVLFGLVVVVLWEMYLTTVLFD
jgi:hypothetical protein